MKRWRTVTLLALLGLVAACGARLTDEQREFALRGVGAQESAAQPGPGGGPAPTDPVLADAVAVDAASPDVAVPEDADGGGDASPQAAQAAPGGDGEADAGGETDDGGEQPTDTRSMPPGGNGGATDTGVSDGEIVLANISDVSGAVPGLFEPEQLAAQAYVEYFTASRGTLFGRQLTYLPMDSQLSAGANRAASIEACERAFAAVGSMSAFDAGGAPVIDECGIPDIRTAATQPPMQVVDSAFPISVTDPDLQPIGEYEWLTENFPSATQNAAYLYIAGEVTAAATAKVRRATTEALGWEWTYVQEIDIAETDYGGFAREMDNRGVEYVTFQGAESQAARLAQAMRQQGFEPAIYHLQANAYTPTLIERAPEAIEGTYITIPSVMVEEAGDHEELQRYAQFLQQVAPGERPTSLGMYSWSAAKLFVEIAERVGPELTREAVIEELRQVEGWDGGGLHPPIDVGDKRPAGCQIIVQVQDGEFTRVYPDAGFHCGSIVPVE